MGFLSGILGGALGAFGGKKQSDLGKEQRAQDAARWAETLAYNRPNQNNPFGSMAWTKDDKGNWTQNVTFNPAEQERLDMFRNLAKNRMNMAQGMDLSRYGKPIDYNALGLGHIASAAGGQGTTGQRQWTNNPYAGSFGGNYLG